MLFKRKSIITLVLLFNIFTTGLFSQAYTFQDYLYSPIHDIPVGACPAVGGGYIIGLSSHALVKLDANGQLAWSKDILFGSSTFFYTAITQTSDSAYIMSGYNQVTDPTSAYDQSLIVTKTDTLGNVIWSAYIDSTNGTTDNNILSTPDGGALVAYTEFGPPYRNIMLARFSGTGSLLWHKRYSISSIKNVAYAITKSHDGGYVITSKYDLVGFILKVDSLGNQVWTKTTSIPITMTNNMTGIARTASGYAFVMMTPDLYFFDDNGTAVTDKIYSAVNGTMTFSKISETSDGGILVSGKWNDATSTGCPMLMKTDSIGNVQWAIAYRRNFCYPVDQFETPDGGYFQISEVVVSNTYKSYAVKTDGGGETKCNENAVLITADSALFTMNPASCVITNGPHTLVPLTGTLVPRAISDSVKCEGVIGIGEINDHGGFGIFPNPTSGIFSVKATKGTTVSVYDMLGNLVLSEVAESDETQMDLSSFAKGMYAVVVSNGKNYSVRKLIKN